MARSGSDPFPITLPERVNDRSKAESAAPVEAPTSLSPEKRRPTAVCGLSLKFGVQTLPAHLRDGEATRPLLDQAQHNKALEASGVGLGLTLLKVEQLADFARAQRRN
jgi:hypothetical protein